MTTKAISHRPITIRWPNEDTGEYFKIPGCMINENSVLALFDHHLEVHLVTPTEDPHEFDLQFASSPMFYVGDNFQDIYFDLMHLTIVEFATKYVHSDYHTHNPN
ncbi:hypothetical protein [Tumebacillus permanentifrigoris]|uniref:Uncharacterized protein n=1 Tax=Tumebacillus permanentifrigoris TaxID=378543 RepID=A0A316D454_9BACL|nr:hypothetical protein [Tumebacillus permanentifrigoris]PWK05155.1 hypothetical protein C7459_12631 [Tumebacillus permanentifrigoris]